MDKELETAIDWNRIDDVKYLIENGVDPQKGNPLIKCIKFKRLEMAKLLIEVGANTTKADKDQRTPLYWAIRERSLAMVKLLLDNGAAFTMYENLESAIKSNNSEIVHELIKRGVDLNSACDRSDFPIMYAVSRGNCDIVKLLLQNKADLNIVDGQESTLISKCIETNRKDSEVLKLLIDKGLNLLGDGVDTLLTKSVRVANIAAIKYLIANKYDLNERNAAKETPLSIALSYFDFRTFQLLIEAGADPKLASGAIAAMVKKNRDFAAYMAKLTTNRSTRRSQRRGFTGHEDAPKE